VSASVENSALVLTVADRGPGLPPEILPRIFDKFYRAPTAPSGGTGLGLSIVKGFVEAQGGQVKAQNRADGGAAFTIRLPIREAPSLPAEGKSVNQSHHRKPTVLVIDDEVQIRRLLRVTLEANGYRVFEAASGRKASPKPRSVALDVVLLDLGLPDLEGTAVLKRLREWTQVPVIVLSVRDREEDKSLPGQWRGRLRDQAVQHW
jgi:CheY-like chemotaxis protein